ncbi:MAG: hypothetical protein M4579_005885 [Chaenotheca gracillima]|nr:MAG: hypothetical protein M4579_005885 [Chaenotheca gracillima]
MAADIQQVPFVKQLAANDRPTRDKAVDSLRTFLSGRRKLDELELLKLWKGLFYCMWMSDRAKTQQRLAVDLAALVDVLPEDNALPFLEAFWKTMAREWNGIDVLRMDKFLFLTRNYLGASFRFLARHAWRPALVAPYTTILSSIPLHPSDVQIPNGLRYHVIDIYVDELDKADTPRSEAMSLDGMLEPLRKLEKEGITKTVRVRAREALADDKVKDWNGEGKAEDAGQDEDGLEDEWNGIED